MSDTEFGTSYRGNGDEEEITSPGGGGPIPKTASLMREAPGRVAETLSGPMAARMSPLAADSPGNPEGDPPPILRGLTGDVPPRCKVEIT